MAVDTETPKASPSMADANVVHSPSSAYAKERIKWEANFTALGPGQRPYVKREYPMMIFLGGRPEGGLGADTVIAYETVGSDREFEEWRHRGYRPSPNEAIEAYQAQELEYSRLNANLEHQKKHTLSEKAAAEVSAAQDAVTGHLPMVPETPIVRRQPREVK